MRGSVKIMVKKLYFERGIKKNFKMSEVEKV